MKPTATDINRRSFLKVAAAGGAAVWSDVAFAVAPSIGGRVTASGKGMGRVVVTDGLNCTETTEDGSWSLPLREGVRFVSVTTPSGWRASCHFTGVPYTASATVADGKLYAVDFMGGVRCFN